MRRILLICLLASLTALPARADISCTTPMDDWQPVASLRAEAVKLGWAVEKIRADDGCYHVKATDQDGRPVEGVFDPRSLKLLGRSDADHENGHHDKGDLDAPKTGGLN